MKRAQVKIQLEIELYYKTKEQLDDFLREFHKELINTIRNNFYGDMALAYNVILNSYRISKEVKELHGGGN